MGTYGPANEKLRNLEEIEKEIAIILQTAANVILEMSKEKPAERNLDRHALQFTASVQRVEMELSSQIRYLTQGFHAGRLLPGNWERNVNVPSSRSDRETRRWLCVAEIWFVANKPESDFLPNYSAQTLRKFEDFEQISPQHSILQEKWFPTSSDSLHEKRSSSPNKNA
ncbi:mediator of RNA polymerase II transcription subunit 11 isoform X1 [Rhincodon typus]|uniref:mediator of RNA polymerase II transcription subunit 11 isoform X1 n=1 Tax=Rhincodon typus TaxID=259920 RepID=UPI00202F0481|nr:mediator of RNA polymerase II transcription subunit 11 isoform X1 [Rhincodon typus]